MRIQCLSKISFPFETKVKQNQIVNTNLMTMCYFKILSDGAVSNANSQILNDKESRMTSYLKGI